MLSEPIDFARMDNHPIKALRMALPRPHRSHNHPVGTELAWNLGKSGIRARCIIAPQHLDVGGRDVAGVLVLSLAQEHGGNLKPTNLKPTCADPVGNCGE